MALVILYHPSHTLLPFCMTEFLPASLALSFPSPCPCYPQDSMARTVLLGENNLIMNRIHKIANKIEIYKNGNNISMVINLPLNLQIYNSHNI